MAPARRLARRPASSGLAARRAALLVGGLLLRRLGILGGRLGILGGLGWLCCSSRGALDLRDPRPHGALPSVPLPDMVMAVMIDAGRATAGDASGSAAVRSVCVCVCVRPCVRHARAALAAATSRSNARRQCNRVRSPTSLHRGRPSGGGPRPGRVRTAFGPPRGCRWPQASYVRAGTVHGRRRTWTCRARPAGEAPGDRPSARAMHQHTHPHADPPACPPQRIAAALPAPATSIHHVWQRCAVGSRTAHDARRTGADLLGQARRSPQTSPRRPNRPRRRISRSRPRRRSKPHTRPGPTRSGSMSPMPRSMEICAY